MPTYVCYIPIRGEAKAYVTADDEDAARKLLAEGDWDDVLDETWETDIQSADDLELNQVNE